jgi:3-oxoacyl-[acyl-carrier protein] reductase
MPRHVLLITGASSDIGIELIRQLTSWGIWSSEGTILAHTRSGEERLLALTREIPALAGRLKVLRADFAVDADLVSMIEQIRAEFGFPSHLVHLAAPGLQLGKVADLNWASFLNDLKVQVGSLGALLRAFLPAMARANQRCKVVVMLSSVTLASPPQFMTQYVTTKYALLGLFRAVAAEYADRPVCINAVSPSMTETRFLAAIPPKMIEVIAAASPTKRNATPADVVPPIRFLLSPESDYIHAANLPVTAGSVV